MHKALLIVLFFVCSNGIAQTSDSTRLRDTTKTERLKLIFGGIAPIAYKGDLNTRYNKWGFNGFLGIQYHKPNVKSRFNGQLDLNAGIIQGSNQNYDYDLDKTATPNTFFRTSYLNINYNLQLVLYKRRNCSLYLSQGIGLFRFVVKDDNFEKLENQLQTREFNESLPSISLALPTKIGGFFLFGKNIGLISEINWLNPNSDYLDNIGLWSNNTKKDKLLGYRIGLVVSL